MIDINKLDNEELDSEETCSIEGCNRVDIIQKRDRLCSKHYRLYHLSADTVGVYLIKLKDKYYVGYSSSGIGKRNLDEISALINNNPIALKGSNLLKYFNEICKSENLVTKDQREQAIGKYFKVTILENSTRYLLRDSESDTITREYDSEQEQKDSTYRMACSNSPEVKAQNEKTKQYWKNQEILYIEKCIKKYGKENILNTIGNK